MDYNFFIAIVIVFTTFFLFRNYLLKGVMLNRIFYLLFVVFFLIYSGLGIGLEGCNKKYVLIYYLYTISLLIGIKISEKINNRSFSYFYIASINKISENGKYIILFYFILLISGLIYPDFKLQLLFSPPRSNLIDHFQNRFVENTFDLISFIRYQIIQLLTPFFLLALFKYYSKPIIIFIVLLAQLYIQFCINAYIGRGAILIFLLSFLIYYYLKYPNRRKYIIFGGIVSAPLMVSFFVFYSYYRAGLEYDDKLINNVFEYLFKQEVSYPLHFDSISEYASTVKQKISYIYWMLTLPSPVSLNFFNFDYGINHIFTEHITGIQRGAYHYSILLPGLVGEAYFIFGNLFFLHALFLGLLFGIILSYLSKSENFLFLKIYFIIYLSYYLCRGGTTGVFPLIFKHLLYFHFLIILFSNIKYRKLNKQII